MLLGDASGSIDCYANDADQNAEQDDLPCGRMEDDSELAVSDGWDDGSEGCAEAERDGVSERDAQVTDGKTEGDAADSPENSEEKGEPDIFRVCEVDLVDDAEEIGDEDGAENDGCNDPRSEALDEPIDLP